MMTLLVRDHVIPDLRRGGTVEIESEVMTDSWVNQDEWLAVEIGDMRLGGLRLSSSHESAREKYILSAHLQVDAALFRARLLSTAVLDRRLRLEQFRLRGHVPTAGGELLSPAEVDAEELPEGTLEATGYVDGQTLLLRLRRADAVQHLSMRLARPVTLADSLAPIMRSEMLTKGVVYSTEVYDPLWGNRAGQVHIEYVEDRVVTVGGEELEVRVIEQRLGSQRLILLVDEDGQIVRRTIPLFGARGGHIAGMDRDAAIVLSRLEPVDARRQFPGLDYIPREPDLRREDVTGTDRGRVVPTMSLFDILSQGGPLRNLQRPPELDQTPPR